MKKIFLLSLIFVNSCVSNPSQTNFVNELNFDQEFNIDQFISKLETYSRNNPYPNIDD